MDQYDERSGTYRWLMSQEASTQRHTYNRCGLPFSKWGSDSCGGLDTVARYLRIRNLDRPHPFGNVGPDGQVLMGEPWLYVVVDDSQRLHAYDDAGFALFRAEIGTYSWAVQKSGELPAKLKPRDKDNHYMDALRCYGAAEFPSIEPRSEAEERAAMVEKLRQNLGNNAMAEMSLQYHMQARERAAQTAARETGFPGYFGPNVDDEDFDPDEDANAPAYRRDSYPLNDFESW